MEEHDEMEAVGMINFHKLPTGVHLLIVAATLYICWRIAVEFATFVGM